jgi:hypothetical protein
MTRRSITSSVLLLACATVLAPPARPADADCAPYLCRGRARLGGFAEGTLRFHGAYRHWGMQIALENAAITEDCYTGEMVTGTIAWRESDATIDGDSLRVRFDGAAPVFEEPGRPSFAIGFMGERAAVMRRLDLLLGRDGTISGTGTVRIVSRFGTDAGPTDADAGTEGDIEVTFDGRVAIECLAGEDSAIVRLADGTQRLFPCVTVPLRPDPPCDDTSGCG